MSLSGKIIAVTGGASGIGLATAKTISERGATVCISDIDANALQNVEGYFSSMKVPFLVTKVDISKRDEVDAWIDEIVGRFGHLDGAANIAGIIGKGHGIKSVAELDDEEWDKIMAVNLTGFMYCFRKELQTIVNGGSIVNVSSIHGTKGLTTSPVDHTRDLN
jgi:NAD(P)-dependent dehydrogenase (short-subunit alcohol dehydrogenase family)